MKKLFLFAAALLATTPAYADITVGYAGPFTGSYAAWGEPAHIGALQAVEDINAAGGIYGEKIRLEEADDACDPKQAVAVANRFVSEDVKYVIGHGCSSASIPAAKIYSDENVIMISALSTNPALTDSGYKTIFRVCGRDDDQGAAQADYVVKHFRNWRIAIIHDNSTGGRGQSEVFRKTLQNAGVKEILFDVYTPGEKDYSALVTKLKQAGIQLVQIGGYHTEVGLIARQIKQQKADIQIIGGDALATDEFWSIAGGAGEGVLMTFEPDARKSPDAGKVIDGFKKKDIDPAGYTLYGYAAVQVLADALQHAGSPDAVVMASYMRKQPFKTVIGPVGFNEKGDATGASYVVYKWHAGKYEETND